MTPEEFQRLKDAEKAHLRQLRDLKQTYHDAQRKKAVIDAVTGMRNPDLEAETDALTERFQANAALQEARMELAMERDDEIARAEADRDAVRAAEAQALVERLRAEATAPPPETPTPGAADAPKTIGRTPPPTAAPPAGPDEPAKTIGRARDH
jgi:hypothetical protein